MTYGQHSFNGLTLSIDARTAGDPTALSETLRRMARERAADVPMKFTTMEAMLSDHMAAPRFRTVLFAVFAGLAVCLAMAGVYGVMAYAVARRTGEIGVRMALGATTGSVLRLVLGEGLVLTGLGLVAGLAIAVAASRLLTSMLFQVRPNARGVSVRGGSAGSGGTGCRLCSGTARIEDRSAVRDPTGIIGAE